MWITDRKPTILNGELVLLETHEQRDIYSGVFNVTTKEGHVTTAHFFLAYNREFDEFSPGYWAIDEKITAWQPLPEAYKP